MFEFPVSSLMSFRNVSTAPEVLNFYGLEDGTFLWLHAYGRGFTPEHLYMCASASPACLPMRFLYLFNVEVLKAHLRGPHKPFLIPQARLGSVSHGSTVKLT